MKINSIQAIPVCYPEPNDNDSLRHLCLVKLTSDDGQVGWGEAVTMWPEASLATKAIIEQGYTPLLLGQSVLDSDRLWRAMRAHSWWYGVGGIASFATAALDIAMWDLKGRATNRSVLDLLGGPVHERLPAVASIHATKADIGAMAAAIAEMLAGKYQGVKVGFGKKGSANLGFEQARDVEFIRAVRHAIGPRRMIMIDVGNSIQWDVATAVERTTAMEEHGLTWIEEPLGADNPEGYATLRGKTTTRIAYGEREWNVEGFRRILQTGTVDVIGVDPGRSEGVTGFRKACDLIEAHGRQANAHAWSSAIVTAASLSVSFNSPACQVFEMKPLPNPMHHELVANPTVAKDGWVYPPTGPGLGIEVDEDVVNRYRLK